MNFEVDQLEIDGTTRGVGNRRLSINCESVVIRLVTLLQH